MVNFHFIFNFTVSDFYNDGADEDEFSPSKINHIDLITNVRLKYIYYIKNTFINIMLLQHHQFFKNSYPCQACGDHIYKHAPKHVCKTKTAINQVSCDLCERHAPENLPTTSKGYIYICPRLLLNKNIPGLQKLNEPRDCNDCGKKGFISESCWDFHLITCSTFHTCKRCGYKIGKDWKKKNKNLPTPEEMVLSHICYLNQLCKLCWTWVNDGLTGHECKLQTYGLQHHIGRMCYFDIECTVKNNVHTPNVLVAHIETYTGEFDILRFYPDHFKFNDEKTLPHHEIRSYKHDYLDEKGKRHCENFPQLDQLPDSDFYLSKSNNAVKNLLLFLKKYHKTFIHSTWLSFNGSRYVSN